MTLHVDDVKVGESRERVLVDDLKRTRIVQYAGAGGDYNPVHTDEVYATEVAGYPGVFAHGMLTMGMAGRVLTDWVGIEALLTYGVRFKAQVWPGDTLTATAIVESVEDAPAGPVAHFSLVTVNQNGVEVVAGTATARLEQ
ncbi:MULTISPECIES: MaoC/PaaZ C-terminal domain-containing protein [unclassified Streptomyces]|uniref:MaoC/PaaZ C-terminal domain-containing protein n=1 Tax=unclassified Streptomyces TaxID=2593676 RepID=UPI0032543F36